MDIEWRDSFVVVAAQTFITRLIKSRPGHVAKPGTMAACVGRPGCGMWGRVMVPKSTYKRVQRVQCGPAAILGIARLLMSKQRHSIS